MIVTEISWKFNVHFNIFWAIVNFMCKIYPLVSFTSLFIGFHCTTKQLSILLTNGQERI